MCLALISTSIGAIVALAATSPDSGPYLLSVNAYQHYIDSNDTLICGYYNLPYATLPADTVTTTYVGRALENGVEVARVAPYAYSNKGFRYGTFWMYISAGNLTWGGNVTVELVGNPTLTWSGAVPYASTSTITWNTTVDSTATLAVLRNSVLNLARELGNYWTLVMVSDFATGTVLSSYGEAYFVNAIPQIRTAAPALFQQAVQVVTFTDNEESTQPQVNILKANWPFDWSGFADWIGLPSEEVVTTGMYLIIFGALSGLVGVRANSPSNGMFAVLLPSLPLAALLGMISVMWAILLNVGAVLAILIILFILR